MKTNKLNLVVIGLAGILSNPASAQKFYQCMPVIKCNNNEYKEGINCIKCPDNSVCKDNKIVLSCPAGTWLYRTCVSGYIGGNDMCPTGKQLADKSTATECATCPTGYYCPGDGNMYLCPALSIAKAGSSECTPIPVKVTLKNTKTEVEDFDYGFEKSITITANGKSEDVAGGGCGIGITAFNTDCVMLRPVSPDEYIDANVNIDDTIEVCLSDPTPKNKGVYKSATFYTKRPIPYFK